MALPCAQARVVIADQPTCADFVELALCEKSTLHQLIYLAATYDQSTGRYQDRTLTEMFTEEEVDRVLQQHHVQVFSSWLRLNVEQQTTQVTYFLAETAANQSETLKDWIDTWWYENLIPRAAKTPERMLFVGDLELVLLIMHAQTYKESPIATSCGKRPALFLAPDPS